MSVLAASTGRHGRDPVLRGPRHPGTQPPDPGAAGCVLVVLRERQLLRRLVESDVDPAPPHRSLNGRHTPCHRKPSQRSQAQVSAPKPRACSIPATGEGAHAPCWPGCRERRRRLGTARCQEHTAWCPLAVAIWAEPSLGRTHGSLDGVYSKCRAVYAVVLRILGICRIRRITWA